MIFVLRWGHGCGGEPVARSPNLSFVLGHVGEEGTGNFSGVGSMASNARPDGHSGTMS